jgi:predicted ribosome quality control (RQC) complex YloA/Tae2 family protein
MSEDRDIIEFDLNKSIEENAANYFNASKEARKKIEGMRRAILAYEQKAKQLEAKKDRIEAQKEFAKERQKVAKKWFERFRWFYSSDGFLVVGGRDAHSNEELVKKHMKPHDLYFHADVFGAPHCYIQTEGKDVPDSTKKEAAQFAVTFSKAWEEGRAVADAYSVKPEQVSKTPNPGEHLGTGAFVIRGEREWFKKTALSCALGFDELEKKLISAPFSAAKKNCSFVVPLKQGMMQKSDAAKVLKNIFDAKGLVFSLDEFVSVLPNGAFDVQSGMNASDKRF